LFVGIPFAIPSAGSKVLAPVVEAVRGRREFHIIEQTSKKEK
jgi:hypothetical protein